MGVYLDEHGKEWDTQKRIIEECPPMAELTLDEQILYKDDGTINTEALCQHFKHEGRLAEEQVLKLLESLIVILKNESNLLRVEAPVTICGDVHGQFFDLCKLFEVGGGHPPNAKYLFLGDYVDRGYFSIETFLYLAACKINHPELVIMLRGNHECRHLTRHFTFKLECEYKYSPMVYNRCMQAFDSLPLTAIVNEQLFCVHGGISPLLKNVEDINKINRFQETPMEGLMCDLLWTDPTEDYDEGRSGFNPNKARGCSHRYSFGAITSFLQKNNLLSVVRGHEAQANGYRLYKKWEKTDFPSLITLFSAPNYVDVYNNQAAVLKYDSSSLNIRQFRCVDHPFHLPKFINAFDWSFPFIGEKMAELLMAILEIPALSANISGLTQEEIDELNEEERRELETEAKAQSEIAEKILALQEVGQAFAQERVETEALSEFPLPDHANVELPTNQLAIAEEEIKAEIDGFKMAKTADVENEMIPTEPAPGAQEVPSLVLDKVTVAFPSPEIVELISKATSPISEAQSPSPSLTKDQSISKEASY